jgi:hypothetical protein
MSLTSYRAAPPRGIVLFCSVVLECKKDRFWAALCFGMGRRSDEKICCCVSQTWQRPTLPRLKTKYHRRWGISRPCSEWERVQPPRHNHQVSEAQHYEKLGGVRHFLI